MFGKRLHSIFLVMVFLVSPGLRPASAFQIAAAPRDTATASGATLMPTSASFSFSRNMQGEDFLGYKMSCLVNGLPVIGSAGPTGTVEFNDITEKTVLATADLTATQPIFLEKTIGLPTGSQAVGVATGDFNKDGKLDLVVALNAGGIAIALGNGDGTFQKAVVLSATNYWYITVGDFNGDGKMDIATVGLGANPKANLFSVSLLLGRGDGTFQPEKVIALPSSVYGVEAMVAGDFNGDGKQDLALGYVTAAQAQAGYDPGSLAILFGNAGGTFQAPVTSALTISSSHLRTGDFNQDGKTDLVAYDEKGSDDLYLLLSNGDGTFQPLNEGESAGPPVVADFNGDGKPDVATVYNGELVLLLGDGKGGLSAQPPIPVDVQPYTSPELIPGDYNGDGYADILLLDYKAILYRGNGNGTLQSPVVYAAASSPLNSVTLEVAADFRNTGYTDLAGWDASSAAVLLNSIQLTGTLSAVAVPAGDATLHDLGCTYLGNQSYAGASAGGGWVTFPQAPAPGFSPAAGLYATEQMVTISSPIQSAIIHYTTDGSTPTLNSTVYSGPIAVKQTELLQATAYRSDYTESPAATALYTINLQTAEPSISPAVGNYSGSVTVNISDSSPGAKIYYTVSGATPTTSSTVYTGPFQLTKTATVKAIAIATGYSQSAVSEAVYTITGRQTAAPVFSLPAGLYSSPQTVTITEATSGAVVHYTLDGSVPTTASAKYTGPITISKTTNLQAIAFLSGGSASALVSAVYTIEAVTAQPTFSPAAGTFGTQVSVSLGDADKSAAIYYTVNGATPTTGSTRYTTPILVTGSETIRAIAVDAKDLVSPVVTASYTVAGTPSVLIGNATAIGASGATVNALVNPQGVGANCSFQYGTSAAALASSTKAQALAGTASQASVSAVLSGLKAKTKYYYRAVVSTVGGSATSAVESFTTE
jgi:hypothetical protein